MLEIIAENVFQGRNVSIEFAKNGSRQDRNSLFMGVKNSSGNNWYITKIEMMVMSSRLPIPPRSPPYSHIFFPASCLTMWLPSPVIGSKQETDQCIKRHHPLEIAEWLFSGEREGAAG
ncbi:MAG: hypothetical protein OXC57_01210 [Rhodobacteraceae bacterium]|nr:hypothetical protein [Paracoccaceae bacterium]